MYFNNILINIYIKKTVSFLKTIKIELIKFSKNTRKHIKTLKNVRKLH